MDTAEKITLFCFLLQGVCCRDFSITLPEKIQALSGSCMIIKCRFEINDTYDKDLTDTATGAWFKDNHDQVNNPVFSSSTSVQNSGIKGNITGKLKDKDCTTVFTDIRSTHSGQYYFRIEGEGKLQWTFAQKSVSIDVIDSPERPLVRVSVDQKDLQDDQEVLEGSSVSLCCSAETLCSSPPPTLTWSSTPRIPLSESSRRQELISDLNFTAAHRHHTLTFTCTVTYQIQERNATAHSSFTLRVQYAPKISSSSNCTIGNVTVCFCEVDGNPSPKVEWHLSGRPVSNSSHMSISEERLNSTGLRSFITLHQSLTHTSTLECVANNTRNSQTKQIKLNFSGRGSGDWPSILATFGLDLSSVLIGVAVVSLVVLMLCIITYSCVRKQNTRRLQTRREGAVRNISTNKENPGDSVYANKDMLSSAGAPTANPESLIYSSIDFTKSNPRTREVESVSSLHVDYAVIQHYSGRGTKTKSSMREVTENEDVFTKTTESKESNEELFTESSQIYAKVKRHNP